MPPLLSTWPESLRVPSDADLRSRSVIDLPVNLSEPQEELVQALSGIDVAVFAIHPGSLTE
jgi:hypothetical protein